MRGLSEIALSIRTLHDSFLAIESGDPDQIDADTQARIGLLETAWEQAVGKPLCR